jgi:hypothetical protein
MSTDVFEIRLCQIVNMYRNRFYQYVNTTDIEITIFFLLDNIAEIRSHGEYSYYGSGFITFEIFANHNYC